MRGVVFAYPAAPDHLVCDGYSLEIGAGQVKNLDLCSYICVSVYIHIHLFIYMCSLEIGAGQVDKSISIEFNLCSYICAYASIYIYICTRSRSKRDRWTNIYLCSYTCVYVHICIYICIYLCLYARSRSERHS